MSIEDGEAEQSAAIDRLRVLLPDRNANAITGKFNDLKDSRSEPDREIWAEYGSARQELRAAALEIARKRGASVQQDSTAEHRDEATQRSPMRFTRYFGPLLDALRSTDPAPMRPAEARAWIRENIEIPAADLSRLIVNGKQSIFENDVHWARFYLAKAGLIGAPKRGLWGLTPAGLETELTPEATRALYIRIRDDNRPGTSGSDVDLPAPETVEDDAEYGPSSWFVGATWEKTKDQMARFLRERIWQNQSLDQFSHLVRHMRSGDRIVVKSSFVKYHGLPFDVGGKPVGVMRIKATGTVTENLNDGLTVKVAWDPPFEPRDWFFYTYRTTIVKADTESESACRLIDFVFPGRAAGLRVVLSSTLLG
jgi:5-methylcytosine-specific restriction enzyme B